MNGQKRGLTVFNTVTLLIPWSILLLRQNKWALESPAAELIIGGYALFMLLSAVLCVLSYRKGGANSGWMKLCLVGHGMYAAFAVMALGLMAVKWF